MARLVKTMMSASIELVVHLSMVIRNPEYYNDSIVQITLMVTVSRKWKNN